ncbi:ribosome small subunit-dependent GTPase A [Faucicola mancuniensis]|uniref:ribosome small subunit-dependent GTPase A n=1 Tax=Faucicola mancuniensis TaxID=1309795 RepID=UPI003977DCB1
MALIRKRKLTDQQTRRIIKQQKQQQAVELDDLMDGVVIANYGKQLEVQATSLPNIIPERPTPKDNEPEPFWQAIELHSVWRCHTRTNLSLIATGDKVRFSADPNTGLGRIEAIYDRKNVIFRPDRYHKLKPIASNVDILAIVFAPLPLPSAQLIDRYLVACHTANIKPLLILNKADLLNNDNNADSQNSSDTALQLLKDYQKLGYDGLITQSDGDLVELKNVIDKKTVIFAGQSGVGKSSLVNQLLPNVTQLINEISVISQLGQHTTTTSRFLPFVSTDLAQGAIIDTPGIREYRLWHLQADDILSGFVELAPLTGECRFRDCKHTQNTPNCAMWQAVERGDVLARRVENLVLLIEETKQDFG